MGICEDQRAWYFPVCRVCHMRNPYQSCSSREKSISVVLVTWCNIAGLYDKFLIIRFERNTMETSLVHCLWHCLLVLRTRNNTGNELVIFPGIVLKTDNKTILLIITTRIKNIKKVARYRDSRSAKSIETR